MPTKHPDLFAALAAAFDPDEVKTRSGGKGPAVRYITARTVANRLDNVLGPENWWDRYSAAGEHSVLCALTIRLPDGQEITKCDAGGAAGMADEGDDDKSQYSDAFKRAAVKWGIGRYLYRDGVPSYGVAHNPEPATVTELLDRERPTSGHANGHTNGKARHEWPGASDPANVPARQQQAKVPTTGKALFAFVKDAEQRFEVGLLKYLNNWAKLQEFPGRMVEWDAEQVTLAYAEAQRKLASLAQTN